MRTDIIRQQNTSGGVQVINGFSFSPKTIFSMVSASMRMDKIPGLMQAFLDVHQVKDLEAEIYKKANGIQIKKRQLASGTYDNCYDLDIDKVWNNIEKLRNEGLPYYIRKNGLRGPLLKYEPLIADLKS